MSDENENSDSEVVEVSSESSSPKTKVERIMDTLDKLAEEGIPQFTNHRASENEKDRTLEDKKNRRALIFSTTILVIFCIMWFTAMFMGKFEMANVIIQIILAIGAGAGIASYIK